MNIHNNNVGSLKRTLAKSISQGFIIFLDIKKFRF